MLTPVGVLKNILWLVYTWDIKLANPTPANLQNISLGVREIKIKIQRNLF